MVKSVYGSRAAENKGSRYTAATRTFQVSEDIMPIAELKARLSEVVRGLENRRPIVVTLNGKPAAVVMSPQEFDRITYRARVVQAGETGRADVEAGRTHTDEELDRRIERRYGKPRKTRT